MYSYNVYIYICLCICMYTTWQGSKRRSLAGTTRAASVGPSVVWYIVYYYYYSIVYSYNITFITITVLLIL